MLLTSDVMPHSTRLTPPERKTLYRTRLNFLGQSHDAANDLGGQLTLRPKDS
jgi:hypothetical protein